jgi:2-iminobutanoate/2-iminopropanoate deaminase
MSYYTITTDKAPEAIGPYSQGVVAGNLLYTAMQIALGPAGGGLAGRTAAEQLQQCLVNIREIVKAGGGGMNRIVKTTIYMTDISQFAEINAVYAGFFGDDPPARGVLEVSALPKGALVAVEAVAAVAPA